VRGLGSDFVLGYIQAMDGEKDPRNLVIVFNTVPTIIQHLPFGKQGWSTAVSSVYTGGSDC